MKIFLLTLVIGAFVVNAYEDTDFPKIVQSCLTELGMDISELGVTKVEDFNAEAVPKFVYGSSANRDCFSTCILKKQDRLTPDGKIPDDISIYKREKGPTFEDDVNACRAESDYCKRGYCYMILFP